MTTIETCLATAAAEWREPRRPAGDEDGFRLACRAAPPATVAEIAAAWPGRSLAPELRALWLASRETELFVDVDYGQWGLRLLSPAASAERTVRQRAELPGDVEAADVVLGEFIGDLELLVVDEAGAVLVTGPLDPRADWYRPAAGLAEFLCRYVEAGGDKYWTA